MAAAVRLLSQQESQWIVDDQGLIQNPLVNMGLTCWERC